MTTLEYLHFLTTAKTLEELWDAHVKQMAGYGFDRLIYGYTIFRTENSLGPLDDFLILSNHAKEYVDGFLNGGRYFDAPMLRWAQNNVGAASWRMNLDRLAAGEMTPGERRVHDFNQSMGVIAGYTISFPTANNRTKGAISLCGRKGLTQDDVDAIWDEHGDEILLVNNVAHLKILTLPQPATRRSLTRRQREVLEWVGYGKTTQDIATIMGLTIATVEKHLRLAREALAVETTAQAVLKAALQNQVYVLDS